MKHTQIFEVSEVPAFSKEAESYLQNLIDQFNMDDALEVKEIEKVTNDSVEVVEYLLKQICWLNQEISKQIDDEALALMLNEALDKVILPAIDKLITKMHEMGIGKTSYPLIFRTFGQVLTMAKNRIMKLEDMFDMVAWTPYEEKFLVDMLIDYSNDGKLFEVGCQNEVFQDIANRLTKVFGKSFSHKKVEKKFKSLKDRYKLWEIVTFWHGVHFNVAENRCEASDATWDAIIKEHPSARKYKKEGENLWCELSLMFGGQVSERTKMNKEIIRRFTEKTDATVIYDNEDDVGDGVIDAVSIVGIARPKLKPVPASSHKTVDGKRKAVANDALATLEIKRFEGDYSCASSRVSSTASSFWP